MSGIQPMAGKQKGKGEKKWKRWRNKNEKGEKNWTERREKLM